MDDAKTKSLTEIGEEYKDYVPPINVTSVIQELIDYIPHKYLISLKYISLTNSSGLSQKRLNEKINCRKRKIKASDSYGMYHGNPSGQVNKAWIEIFVDKILNDCPPELLENPFCKHLLFAKTLYHEIGHHIHCYYMSRWRSEEPEDIADEWQDKLSIEFIAEKYGKDKAKEYARELCKSLEKIVGKENLKKG